MILHRDKIIQQQKSNFNNLMNCCRNEQQAQHRAIDILRQQPELCRNHRKKIKFICYDCMDQALLCSDCILDHREHDWVSLATFLNEDVINLFETGKSKSGIVVEEFVDKIVSNLVDFQARIQTKLKESLALIMINLEKLKAKFPTEGGYQITGNRINQKNIKQINSILKNQKYVFDTTRIEKLYNEVIQISQLNINQLFLKIQETLCNHEWDVLQEKQIDKIERNFTSLYKKTPPLKKFFFSNVQKNRSIKVINNKLTAVYENQLPKCPVILLDKFFTPQHSQVAFKITKLQTHAYFFNLSVIYVGVCNSSLADGFGYTDFAKPSKGAYLISSAGRCYHSKLPEYDDKRISFGFAAGDIICLDVNFPNKTVKFEKKTSKIPFGNVFEMPLSLQPKFVDQLKPCIMFSNELGAEITILNETELVLQLDGKEVFKVKNT